MIVSLELALSLAIWPKGKEGSAHFLFVWCPFTNLLYTFTPETSLFSNILLNVFASPCIFWVLPAMLGIPLLVLLELLWVATEAAPLLAPFPVALCFCLTSLGTQLFFVSKKSTSDSSCYQGVQQLWPPGNCQGHSFRRNNLTLQENTTSLPHHTKQPLSHRFFFFCIFPA